ncbi:TIGR04141 family sporadically distributed protein [Vagococcus sp. BWB3-3]|uniref:TIGR04141 family sporadically distributed protein n=1 Tax=Vagococcus allomyrinae TaxID=2794353 RepID=A0A940P3X2_9ENTE|nr:DUF6119 family protein [Vagococcus allomyrinae]MBP1040987.1 TIGR04141 family sporadically distributed protein [Vagococcus allomyrinae]
MKLILSKFRSNSLSEVIKEIEGCSYVQIGGMRKEPTFNLEMRLFFESHEKKPPVWLSEIIDFFNVESSEQEESNINQSVLHQYNAIIILKTRNNLYAHSFGQGFRTTEKFIDSEFGLKFAEKTIRSEQITLKNVSYIQKNKMKGIMNYKKDQGEFPKASESYAFVSGRPEFELFGNSIDCGTGVSFPKNYAINTTEGFYKISELLDAVDTALKSKSTKTILPRVKKVAKKSKLTTELDEEALSLIINSTDEINIAIDVSKIHLENNSIDVYSENSNLEIYISNNLKVTIQRIDATDDSIVKYIKHYQDKILSLDNVRIRVTNEDNHVVVSKSLKEWIYCELEYNKKVYILDSGSWGYFNDRFSLLLEQQLNDINRIVTYSDHYNINYISGEGHFSGEGGYIEELTKKNTYVKLHQRNVLVNGTTIEVADIYDKESKELIAIKRGMDTSNCMYSFEQSVLSVQILRNSDEFNVKSELLKYNNRRKYADIEKYPNIRESMIDKILDSRQSSVLWLHNTKKYVEMTEKEQFDLNQIGSMLLKLKIVDWYSFVNENNYTPKIYMGIDKPAKA